MTHLILISPGCQILEETLPRVSASREMPGLLVDRFSRERSSPKHNHLQFAAIITHLYKEEISLPVSEGIYGYSGRLLAQNAGLTYPSASLTLRHTDRP